jgi:hypothetical protein
MGTKTRVASPTGGALPVIEMHKHEIPHNDEPAVRARGSSPCRAGLAPRHDHLHTGAYTWLLTASLIPLGKTEKVRPEF